LRQARLRACCNQFTGQLKLGRLCVIGLANIAHRSDALGFDENRTSAKEGGKIAGNARKALEAKTGKKVVSKANNLTAAPSPVLVDAPEPAAPSKPKVRVKSKVPKGA
jgi:hypothetical protein